MLRVVLRDGYAPRPPQTGAAVEVREIDRARDAAARAAEQAAGAKVRIHLLIPHAADHIKSTAPHGLEGGLGATLAKMRRVSESFSCITPPGNIGQTVLPNEFSIESGAGCREITCASMAPPRPPRRWARRRRRPRRSTGARAPGRPRGTLGIIFCTGGFILDEIYMYCISFSMLHTCSEVKLISR